MPTEREEYRQRINVERLDWLRGLAATYVVVNHARGHFFVGGRQLLAGQAGWHDYLSIAVLQVTSLGKEFVILFFVLSGFAMAHSVSHSSSVRRFYLKRIVRIWPPYIAATLLAAAVGLIVGRPINPLPVMFYLKTNNGLTPQFWSLPYEIVFYAMCPLVAVRYFRTFAAAAMLAMLATVLLRGLLLNPWPSLLLNFAGNEAMFFVCGIAAYRNFERIPVLSREAMLAVAVVAFALTWGFKMLLHDSNLISCAVIIAATVLAIRNVPAMPKWSNFGRFSYSIYIFHFALIALLGYAVLGDATRLRNPVAWVLAVPLAIAGCYLLYLVTERISNGWVRKLRSVRPQSAPLTIGEEAAP